MVEEINLRTTNTGTYEFALREEGGTKTPPMGYARLYDMSLPDSFLNPKNYLRIRLFYDSDGYYWKKARNQTKRSSATLAFNSHSNINLYEFLNTYAATVGAKEIVLAQDIQCTETVNLLPLISVVGVDALNSIGECNLKHPDDVNSSYEAHLLKALAIYFLMGRLVVEPTVMVARITRDGVNFESNFYFKCDGPNPITIEIKVPDNSFLEVTLHSGDWYRFIT